MTPKPLTLKSLEVDNDALRQQVADLRHLFQRALRWFAFGLGAFLVVIALVVVIVNQQFTDIKQSRLDAQRGACLRANESTAQINGLLLSFGVPQDGSKPRTADQQRLVDAYLKSKQLPRRDCTEAGLKAFYAKGSP